MLKRNRSHPPLREDRPLFGECPIEPRFGSMAGRSFRASVGDDSDARQELIVRRRCLLPSRCGPTECLSTHAPSQPRLGSAWLTDARSSHSRSKQCSQLLDSATLTSSPRMVCQSVRPPFVHSCRGSTSTDRSLVPSQTCEDYAKSERDIVASSTLCPGNDLTRGFRQGNITKD